MRKFYQKILSILVIVMIMVPMVSRAEVFISQTGVGTEIVSGVFKIHYKVNAATPSPEKVFLWYGEYDKTPGVWISKGSTPLANITASSVGNTFNAEISLNGLTPGKKYSYAIANKNSGAADDAFFFDVNTAESLIVKCFKTTGSVPCKETTSPQTPPTSSSELSETSFDLFAQSQSADTVNVGKFVMNFKIDQKVTLTGSLPVILKIFFEPSTGNKVFVKEGQFPITPGGSVFPSANDLVPGYYSAQLFRASDLKKISGEISFVIKTATGGMPTEVENIGTGAFNLLLNSVVADTNKIDFDVTIGRKDGVSTAGQLVVSVGKTGTIPIVYDKTEQLWSGLIDDAIQTNGTVSGLAPNTSYSYKFKEIVSGTEFPAKTISTIGGAFGPGGDTGGNPTVLDFGGQSNTGGATGACGGAHGGVHPNLTSSSANLCSKGFVQQFIFSGTGWTWNCTGTSGVPTPCNATQASDTNYGDSFLKNPLAPGLDTFPKIFAAVYNNIILPIAVPFIVLAIMYAGFKFIVARKSGATTTYADAKRILKYTLIGTALLLGGWVIANALQGTLNSLLGPDGGKAPTTITTQ